jgi:hypothetical protein
MRGWWLLVLGIAACDGGEPIVEDTDAADTDSASDTDAVTFAAVDAILQRSCATYGCHAGPELNTGLDLSSAQAYASLVNAPSAQATGVDRVEPGDAANSYLIAKLAGTQESLGGSGDRMPSPFGLSQDELDLISAWVDAGAPE